MKNTLLLIIAACSLAAVLTLSHALLRAAATQTPMEYPWAIRVGTSLFLYGSVFFVYTMLLRHFDISVLYPIYTALSIIGVSLVGITFFGETLTVAKICGVILLVVGIGLVSA